MKKMSLLFSVVLLFSCDKTTEDIDRPLRSELLSVVLRTNTAVEVEGQVNGPTNAEYGVVYGTKPQPTLADEKQSKGQIAKSYQYFTLDVSALSTGKRYYFRVYVKANDAITYSTQTDLLIDLPQAWRSLGRAQVEADYQPLPEILADERDQSLTCFFKSPDSEALEGVSSRVQIGDGFVIWNSARKINAFLLN